ncbi:MAG: hypothetical protein IJE84_06130, partial [Clostridia bacterium]|nr:hypothetical protein [Clostridia bacterium]
EREFFYPLRKQWYITTRQRVYHQHGIAVLYLITPLGVYQNSYLSQSSLQDFWEVKGKRQKVRGKVAFRLGEKLFLL